jgi:hypothetical protein
MLSATVSAGAQNGLIFHKVKTEEQEIGRNSFRFEAIPSGPQPLRNSRRRPHGTAAGQLVGDYGNPILNRNRRPS